MNWSPIPLADVFMAMLTMVALGLLIGGAVSVGSESGLRTSMLLTSGVTVLAQCCLYWAIRDLKK